MRPAALSRALAAYLRLARKETAPSPASSSGRTSEMGRSGGQWRRAPPRRAARSSARRVVVPIVASRYLPEVSHKDPPMNLEAPPSDADRRSERRWAVWAIGILVVFMGLAAWTSYRMLSLPPPPSPPAD